MASYPVEIRRCQHVSAKGTQCGSPALKGNNSCYYHEQCKGEEVPSYANWEDASPSGTARLPALDDAHSIQVVIRQVMILLMRRQIDQKTAGLMLYGCQIASTNLKRMTEEKPQPTQVVVEPEKVGETPLGMTPWSASGEGHDPEVDPRSKSDEPSIEELEEDLEEAQEESRKMAEYAEQVVGNCRLSARASANWIRHWITEATTVEGMKKGLDGLAKSYERDATAERWEQFELSPLEMVRERLAEAIEEGARS
ncbi:MAG TPA: hypothetical protein VMI10_06230 [Terriglobales bacterium]|nr:hypothetical protein [Terriglobales bacterium]